MADLPEFDNPPVVEVAIGVQFRALPGLRGLNLAPLQAIWRQEYPIAQEQPPLGPVVEGDSQGIGQLQLSLLPVPIVRQWFLSDSGNGLIQIQPDRFLVNWRALDPPAKYPRYKHMRSVFEARFGDLTAFVKGRKLGELDVVQAELSYINVIQVGRENLGRIETFLKGWSGTAGHHLDPPEEARLQIGLARAGATVSTARAAGFPLWGV